MCLAILIRGYTLLFPKQTQVSWRWNPKHMFFVWGGHEIFLNSLKTFICFRMIARTIQNDNLDHLIYFWHIFCWNHPTTEIWVKLDSGLSLDTRLTTVERLSRKRCCDTAPDRCQEVCPPTILFRISQSLKHTKKICPTSTLAPKFTSAWRFPTWAPPPNNLTFLQILSSSFTLQILCSSCTFQIVFSTSISALLSPDCSITS